MKNKDVAHIGLYIAAGAAFGGLIYSQTTRERTTKLNYTASEKENRLEIREYKEAIIAQVEIEGQRLEALDRGFSILADYIRGKNTEGSKIAMTAPVIQQGGPYKWLIEFVMPDHYTLDSLPQPTNPLISIREMHARQVAVIRFSGSTKNSPRILDKTMELGRYIVKHGHEIAGDPYIAFYDPPWTLPFLRRNEVQVELQTATAEAESTIEESPKVAVGEKPKLVAGTKAKLAKKG